MPLRPPLPRAWLAACAAVLAAATAGPAAAQGRNPAPPAPAAQALPAAVAEALQRAQVPPDALGALVLPLSHPGRPWQHQADRPMQPASTMKLLTSLVALDRLGPSHRGFTELLTRAPQQGELLAGDLVLRGGADPELGLPQLWALLAELRHTHGIREIAGDIVLDRTLFRPARPDLGLPPFDEHPEFPYNVVPDALQVGGGLMELELDSRAAAAPEGGVRARTLPALPGIRIDAGALRPSTRPCTEWRQDWVSPPQVAEEAPGQWRLTLQGGFPAGCVQRARLALLDRALLAERQLRWLWEGLGGRWEGRAREAESALIAPVAPVAPSLALAGAAGPAPEPASLPAPLPGGALVAPGVAWAGSSAATPDGVRLLARRLARPWGEVLRQQNKQSDNAVTQLLFLSLGLAAMADEPGASTADLARRAVLRWLAEQQIDSAGLVLDNGTGLSRSERLSARQLALALQAGHRGRWAPDLLASLPVAGTDGTLRQRLRSGPAAGWARLKTGALRNVSALAGYVPDAQGRWWVLVAMVNHEQAAAARPALDALVDWVAAGDLQRPDGPGGSTPKETPGRPKFP